MPQPLAQDHKEWALQVSAIAANTTDLSHLAAHGVRLGEVLVLARELTTEQANLTAKKQDVSKRLQAVMDEGRKLSAFLKVGVKQFYGNRSEKLVEFGLQPFRSRPRTQLLFGPDGKPLKPSAQEEKQA